MRELCNVVTSVPGHVGRLVFGSVAGVDVVVMQGRIHSYEHHSMWQVHCDACAHHLYYLQNLFLSLFEALVITELCLLWDVSDDGDIWPESELTVSHVQYMKLIHCGRRCNHDVMFINISNSYLNKWFLDGHHFILELIENCLTYFSKKVSPSPLN